ncbi:MAG: Na+/H+ antiporter subunit E [Gammaproteobacteria bacterium]|nr:Na+/H+ antiporter subunit E [Gammaproteobacteria bacterium]
MTSYRSTSFIVIFITSFLLWLLLTGSLNSDEVTAGIFLSLLISWLSAPSTKIFSGLKLSLTMPLALIKYLLYFLTALIKANLQIAKIVLSPTIKIQPHVVKINTTMNSDLGKLLLANSITLTPGTLSVDVIDNTILVHWINCPFPDDSEIDLRTRQIVDKFEVYLKGFVH